MDSQEAKRWKSLYEQMRRRREVETGMLEDEIYELKLKNFRFSNKVYSVLESKGFTAKEIFDLFREYR